MIDRVIALFLRIAGVLVLQDGIMLGLGLALMNGGPTDTPWR